MTRRDTSRTDYATTAPTRPPVDIRGPDLSADRILGISVSKPTPTDRVYAALHLHDRGLREVAEVLGLGSAYDAITRAKEAA